MDVLAHEAWFVHHPESYPLDWSALVEPLTLAGVAAVVVVAVVWRLAARAVPTPELAVLRPLGRLVPWVPRLLAIHLGVSLLALSAFGSVLDPSVQVGSGAWGWLLLAPQVVAGVLLVAGRQVRLAAAVVAAAGPVLLVLEGPRQVLASLVLLGIAVFLVLLPPDRALGGRVRVDADRLRPAVLALRIGAAGSLAVLAVVEKLANPDMGAAMLEQEPVLNLLSPLGVDAAQFVLFAGLVELLFALLVLSGATPQVVALVAAVPFTSSLALFGTTELVGHLPVYGVLLTLLLLGSRADSSAEVSHLPSTQDLATWRTGATAGR
jgi:uncharacterized membrane protein YphA (DoxX/SURF4 family)